MDSKIEKNVDLLSNPCGVYGFFFNCIFDLSGGSQWSSQSRLWYTNFVINKVVLTLNSQQHIVKCNFVNRIFISFQIKCFLNENLI